MTNDTNLVRIALSGPNAKPLSKVQKEFNRLSARVAELEKQLTDYRASVDAVQQRIQQDYLPLLNAYNQSRADLVRLFDRYYDNPEATRPERRKLARLIVDMGEDLLFRHGFADLRPIVGKYSQQDMDQADDAVQPLEQMKQQAAATYGLDLDDLSFESPEELMTYIEQQVRERQAAQEQRQSQSEQAKSAQQQASDAKQAAKLQQTTRTIRTLYRDLVKAYHPDREPDEAEKERKTAIMQRITEAYEKGDLMALLRLQLTLSELDQERVNALADEPLRQYNKLLKQQIDRLTDELMERQQYMASLLSRPLTSVQSTFGLEISIGEAVNALKRDVKAIKQQLKSLTQPAFLKAWLQAYYG
ncbi:J domain-containing protein [Spirosoma luteolum]